MAAGYWSPGDGVLLREVRRSRVWSAPVTVVQDGPAPGRPPAVLDEQRGGHART
jgi:hypothetical protein